MSPRWSWRWSRIVGRAQPLRRLLDIFWILGTGTLLLGVGEIVQAHRQAQRLTDQVIPVWVWLF